VTPMQGIASFDDRRSLYDLMISGKTLNRNIKVMYETR